MENDNVLVKYNEIWNKVKKALNINFHSKPVYDKKYLKSKVKAFNKVDNTIFSGNEIPKESIHYICIVAISINSIMIIL